MDELEKWLDERADKHAQITCGEPLMYVRLPGEHGNGANVPVRFLTRREEWQVDRIGDVVKNVTLVQTYHLGEHEVSRSAYVKAFLTPDQAEAIQGRFAGYQEPDPTDPLAPLTLTSI